MISSVDLNCRNIVIDPGYIVGFWIEAQPYWLNVSLFFTRVTIVQLYVV